MAREARFAQTRESSLDLLGAVASIVCAVHCAGVALLLGIAPSFEIVAAPWVDQLFLGASFLVGMLALIPGYRQHRHPVPLLLFSAGIAILAMARLMRMPPSKFELMIVLVAASALVTAHWRNSDALRSRRDSTAPSGAMLPGA